MEHTQIVSNGRTNWSAKLAHAIDAGRASATRVLEQVQSQIPSDRLIKAKSLAFNHDETRNALIVRIPTVEAQVVEEETIHDHALGQFAERVHIPTPYVRYLSSLGADGNRLLAHNLEELNHQSTNRYLLRSVHSQVRGVLSDKYKPLDARPFLEAFTVACGQIGAEPYSGHALDTQIALTAIVPTVYEPIPGEAIAFGLRFQTSDFGDGALSLAFFILRLVCLNGMKAEQAFREVHRGPLIEGDFELSDRTKQKSSELSLSLVQDVVENRLASSALEEAQQVIRIAHECKINVKEAQAELKKRLGVGLAQDVVDAFNSPDVEMMPAGNTKYRLSQAISWVAGRQGDGSKQLELEAEAGRVLTQAAYKQAA